MFIPPCVGKGYKMGIVQVGLSAQDLFRTFFWAHSVIGVVFDAESEENKIFSFFSKLRLLRPFLGQNGLFSRFLIQKCYVCCVFA